MVCVKNAFLRILSEFVFHVLTALKVRAQVLVRTCFLTKLFFKMLSRLCHKITTVGSGYFYFFNVVIWCILVIIFMHGKGTNSVSIIESYLTEKKNSVSKIHIIFKLIISI